MLLRIDIYFESCWRVCFEACFEECLKVGLRARTLYIPPEQVFKPMRGFENINQYITFEILDNEKFFIVLKHYVHEY